MDDDREIHPPRQSFCGGRARDDRRAKSFMAVGPTLHYSHKNVQRCWLFAVVVFGLSCFFFSRIVSGSFWSFNFQALTSSELWRLDRIILAGVSIFEYPWMICVLGLLMGIFAIVPVLVSQLLSFSYSLPLIAQVFFLANLPGLAICLLISCIAAACRPLRFRSRFTAIALCTAPQLLYWGCCGGARGVEPIKWGFSFAPWVCAWLIGLAIAGLVLGIGHFTRYRPGLVWIFTAVFLFLAILTFEMRIGFDELDYQLYVAKNNPEYVSEFHDHSITEALDKTIKDPVVRSILAGFFYPTEPIPLRKELKKEIQIQLSYDRWPGWFIMPDELKYQEKKRWLNQQYELFINPPKPWWMPPLLYTELKKRRSASKRMPMALYYKALLSEYSPDTKLLGQKEILHFYNDWPHERSRELWYRLYLDFGDSPESIEARWRIARHWAGLGMFKQADGLLAEAQRKLSQRLKLLEQEQTERFTLHGGQSTFFSPFRPPADSAMTAVKLDELQRKLAQLRNLIGPENLSADEAGTHKRLAEFVMLNPYNADFPLRLDELLEQMGDDDPLRDNILLAKTKLVADEQLRAEQLNQLHKKFQNTDGGMQALYELARLKIGLYQNESDAEKKKKYLADARALLTSFISLYPDSFCTEQAKKNLNDLPTVE
ncbi:MAG: hypothetical protein ACE5NM_05875 [Sedimentisphaerales bacterium]